MDALQYPFSFTVTDGDRSITLRKNDHVRIYPAAEARGTGKKRGFGELLSGRQVDLLRIATAVHVADGWARRRIRRTNGYRSPILDVEVLDAAFWERPDTLARLKSCVDFLSGGDDWVFRFRPSSEARGERQRDFFRALDPPPVVSLYSGGLDSAAGLAARLAASPGREFLTVNVRFQASKGRLVHDHLDLLDKRGLAKPAGLRAFVVNAFIKRRRIRRELAILLREVTHRCRPMLFMAVAGVRADTVGAGEVEVYESGVGSVNLPLVSGPADWRTTRSTHPRFLHLMSELVGHVCETGVRYVLPFSGLTKAEMVGRLKELGLEELARRSVSCILHPLKRPRGRQCGHCPACVYRRQAMIVAGVREEPDAYEVDLFAPPEPARNLPRRLLEPIRAFHQQVGRLAELDGDRVPSYFRRYLRDTHAVIEGADLTPYVALYRRYRREWEGLIAGDRRLGFPWIAPARSLAFGVGGGP